MQSIGNDIIALSSVDKSRVQNPRFYSKILAQSEQQLHRDRFSTLPFYYFVWLLWSVKESAYKCLQRHQPDLVFSPVNTVVTDMEPPEIITPSFPRQLTGSGFNDAGCFKSVVRFQSQVLYGRSVIYGEDLIHTVVSFDADFKEICWGIKLIEDTSPKNQSAEIRAFFLDRLKLMLPNSVRQVEKHTAGYPFISVDGRDTGMPLSFSHHEGWVGYAFSIKGDFTASFK